MVNFLTVNDVTDTVLINNVISYDYDVTESFVDAITITYYYYPVSDKDNN